MALPIQQNNEDRFNTGITKTVFSDSHRRHLSEANMGHKPTWSGPHSPETKAKISDTQKGKPKSEIHRQHMRDAQRARRERERLAKQQQEDTD